MTVDKRGLWQNIQRRLDSSPLPWRAHIAGFQMAVTTDGLAALIDSWMQEDPTEQRETFDHLVRGLNENRRGGRELFPEALKGKTW